MGVQILIWVLTAMGLCLPLSLSICVCVCVDRRRKCDDNDGCINPPSCLQQCANSKSLKEGKWVHLHLNLTGLKKPNSYISNHLINMYCKCGNVLEARKVFDKMSERNLYSWNNTLIAVRAWGFMEI